MGRPNNRNGKILRKLPLLLCLAGLCTLVFYLAGKYDVMEMLFRLSRQKETHEIDEILVVLAILALFFAIYNFVHLKKAQRQQKALAQANEDLHKALADIKQLRGMIPICANCKSIRNDDGYWEQMEAYIRDHSDADFSHGLCPTCISELYPDFRSPKSKES